MSHNRLLIALAALALVALACSFTVNLPTMETGETVIDEISVPLPEDNQSVAKVRLNFAAGELNLEPGTGDYLVSGTATYNVSELKPEVTIRSDEVIVAQEGEGFDFIPILGNNIENRWDFRLGTIPMELTIAAGGYKGDFELGGMSLRSLHITEGGSETRLSFSESNQDEMDLLRIETGASNVTVSGLANANFSRMELVSGAGNYVLDFSGELQRDASVSIKSGLSNVSLTIPEGTAARLSVTGGLSNVNANGEWRGSGDEYVLEGEGPELDISVEMGAGNLELHTR
jgi:N-terminal domain of toast_rack, DUF2154